ncbi:Maf family protein [Pseudidiomarina sp.]|uniref:Maf family protein n=1 Tax=Pseudidiomarina sp. TaxID=2081707 RepID=UPI003A970465
MSAKTLALASGSPRRFELLQLLDRPFSVVRPQVPEQIQPHETPLAYVQRLALSKAHAGAQLCDADTLVLGADTIVMCDNLVLEKPHDYQHFVRMMKMLSGKTHQAVTAVAGVLNAIEDTVVSCANVTFKTLSEAEIEAYWHSGEPQDKAGGYGIQGRASKFVTHLEGSYFAVVGLPMYETEQLIQTIEGRA